YPEGVLDEPYAFTYAEMVELYRQCVVDAAYMETVEQRDDLANDVDLYMQQCLSEAWMDPDAFFYNGLIARMHDLFSHLYDEVYNYFLDPERYVYYEGLYIYWDELKDNCEDKLAVRLESQLKEVLAEIGCSPDILYCKEFDARKEDSIILFSREDDQDENSLVKILHDEGVAFLKGELPKDTPIEIDDVVSYMKLCECLVCGFPEPYEDFGFNESYNVFACSVCDNLVRK
ncbi:hypothetical protein J4G37_34605, partial [Microvirga sp. 3-52]|nr:hypothetical protein [Microvirga sp. 3-52]